MGTIEMKKKYYLLHPHMSLGSLSDDPWARYKHFLDTAHHNFKTHEERKAYVSNLPFDARKFVINNWSKECGSPYCNSRMGSFSSREEERAMLALP